MREIITNTAEKLKKEFMEFFMTQEISVDNAEAKLIEMVHAEICSMMASIYELIDEDLYQDKEMRKASGMKTERRGDIRRILSRFGEISYRRTYYQCADGTRIYPVDEMAGIEKRQRITTGVSEALVRKAIDFSYDKSRKMVTNGAVSKQTVMNKIRASEVPKTEEKKLKPHVEVLHIDADEDHVSMQSGSTAQVPVICAYEGIQRLGKRGVCVNKKAYSEYGMKTPEFWEEVWDDIWKRYELTGTKIILHGDGAAWIKQGLEYIPGSEYVLDPYHKNKAIKQLYAGIKEEERERSERTLREAMSQGDDEVFEAVIESVLSRNDIKKTNEDAGEYLLRNYEGIRRYYVDEDARKGGATEPHVSHILSARLSSRPMGWSEETLKSFVPILAARECRIRKELPEKRAEEEIGKVVERCRGRRSAGLPDPDRAVLLQADLERESPLYKMLHYPGGRWCGAPISFSTKS